MRSRGLSNPLGAGARKSFVLFWTALFVCSLLLQYVVIAAPVLAAHDQRLVRARWKRDGRSRDRAGRRLELDRSRACQRSTSGPLTLRTPPTTRRYFTSGGSKDVNDISQWAYTTNDIAPDKDQILDAFAAAYQKNGETWVYFGADRFDGSGDAFIGFWFVQGQISLDGNGGFNGVHHNGDILVVSDFTNGGSVSQIKIYEWLNGSLSLKVERRAVRRRFR